MSKKKNRNSLARSSPSTNPATRNNCTSSVIAKQFSGPMPPPEMLREYDEVLPGLANRIVTLAENQSNHRIGLERRVTTSNIWRAHLGQVFAFVIAIAGIVSGTYLIMNNKSAEGIAAILTPIAGVAGVFIWRTRKQREELESKTR